MTESRSKYRFSREKVKIRHSGGVLETQALENFYSFRPIFFELFPKNVKGGPREP